MGSAISSLDQEGPEGPQEPPLTPEEEEEAPPDGQASAPHYSLTEAGKQLLAQVRRPPCAVDYATEGGLAYQILLSGDAEVIAEDGVLKIKHAGPVLGIVRVQPVQTEAGK